ncbi:hypothetical protein [Burkholderia plantarii]|uniref:hypothetical protein n=1 Tax=Burkholderia plantarii TaxID=41899 RepID=UPI00114CA00A|nr:hypothetical protein [Burkholderia plantarii]
MLRDQAIAASPAGVKVYRITLRHDGVHRHACCAPSGREEPDGWSDASLSEQSRKALVLPRATLRSIWNADRAFKMASSFICRASVVFDIRLLAYRYAEINAIVDRLIFDEILKKQSISPSNWRAAREYWWRAIRSCDGGFGVRAASIRPISSMAHRRQSAAIMAGCCHVNDESSFVKHLEILDEKADLAEAATAR